MRRASDRVVLMLSPALSPWTPGSMYIIALSDTFNRVFSLGDS